MITYTVHEPPPASDALDERAERLTFVKEGFAWLALLFPVLWLLFHRMWWVLLGFVGAWLVLGAGMTALNLGDTAAGLVSLALSFALALEANELRRWTLRRRGYAELGIVTGKSREECEFRFLSAWLDEMADHDYAFRAVPAAGGRARTAAESPSELVVGLFPRPGR